MLFWWVLTRYFSIRVRQVVYKIYSLSKTGLVSPDYMAVIFILHSEALLLLFQLFEDPDDNFILMLKMR